MALTGVAQLAGGSPVHGKVAGLIPCQGTCPDYGLSQLMSPQSGVS